MKVPQNKTLASHGLKTAGGEYQRSSVFNARLALQEMERDGLAVVRILGSGDLAIAIPGRSQVTIGRAHRQAPHIPPSVWSERLGFLASAIADHFRWEPTLPALARAIEAEVVDCLTQ